MDKKNIESMIAAQYDIVLNGYEIGGGGMRSHKPEALKKVFEIMGYAEERIENVEELISAASKFGVGETTQFLEEVALLSSSDERKSDEVLTLMTLHSAKGLEFHTVFLLGVEEGLFPHSRSLFEQSELEEERRLAYVGITRAKRLLYMTYANSRVIFGQVKNGMPSRFLDDIPEDLIEEIRSGEIASTTDLVNGDLIRHEMFGLGKIIQLDDDEALVQFESSGKKRIALALSPVERVEPEEINDIYY